MIWRARETDPLPPEWVSEARDISDLRTFLSDRPAQTAAFLGRMEPRYMEVSRWFAGGDEDGVTAVVLVYTGQSLPEVRTDGDAAAVARIFEAFPEALPPRYELTAPPEHLKAVRRRIHAGQDINVLQMALGREELVPATGGNTVRRLGHSHTAQLVALYDRAGIRYFDPSQLELGLYFGIWDDARLVSAAGVLSVSKESRVAVVGNTATHPDYRGRGLSRCCTARLLREVFRRSRVVALDVPADNSAAVSLYESLGFRQLSSMARVRVNGQKLRRSEPTDSGLD